jgi:hypothetical protein
MYNKSTKQYSIELDTKEDFKRISNQQKRFGWTASAGFTFFWGAKAKRDKAVRILDKEYGITVDTFDFE